VNIKYEGRSTNKLQNGVIKLLFKIWKFRNIGLRFVGDLIQSTSCEFYYDDVTVTSFIIIRYGSVAAMPLKASHKKQRSVTRFRWAKAFSANAIQSDVRPVCGTY